MNDIQMSSLLGQLRSLSARAAVQSPSIAPAAPSTAGFGDVFRSALESVNRQQTDAARLTQDFERGRAELPDAMLAMQKSQVSFKAMTEVRNKLVQAYQDILNMPI